MIRLLSRFVAALAVLCTATAASAGDVTVVVRDSSGKPVADAVVIVDAPGRTAPGRFIINQRDMKFDPFVLTVPVGSTIMFANLDPFRHHVYSFSPARKFELKLFGQGQTRPVQFDKVGLVAIGCNIHDSMQAFIQVVDTPFAARSGADGRVVLREVPASARSLKVWHPHLRAPGNELTIAFNASKDLTVPVAVRLRRAAPMHHAY